MLFFVFLTLWPTTQLVCVVFLRRLVTVPVPSKVTINFVKESKTEVVRFLKVCIQNDVKEQIFMIFSVKYIAFCNSSKEVLILPRASQTNFSLRKLLNYSIFQFL